MEDPDWCGGRHIRLASAAEGRRALSLPPQRWDRPTDGTWTDLSVNRAHAAAGWLRFIGSGFDFTLRYIPAVSIRLSVHAPFRSEFFARHTMRRSAVNPEQRSTSSRHALERELDSAETVVTQAFSGAAGDQGQKLCFHAAGGRTIGWR